MKISRAKKTFDICNIIFLVLLAFITLYPFWYILVGSFSSQNAIVASKGIMFLPKEFNVDAYKTIFVDSRMWTGYRNTLIYVFVGTLLSVITTTMAGYCLSRRLMFGKKVILWLLTFTMIFSGGLIPSYIVVNQLNLLDTPFAIILPRIVSAWNIFITITFFRGINESLSESAKIDGANDFTIFFKIFLPISLPIIAVNILFFGVANWNEWFSATIYLGEAGKMWIPLQVHLRDILIRDRAGASDGPSLATTETVKFATTIFATLPIVFIYPFFQKYFATGLMMGSVKG